MILLKSKIYKYQPEVMNDTHIVAAANKFGTPLYIYDKRSIKERISQITSIPYSSVKIFAATMANNNLELLQLYKKLGLGAFINSIKHLELCKKAGFRGKEIMWTSTGMNERQMKAAIKAGVMLNLDSASQIELYGRLNPGGSVGLRVNIGNMPNNESYAGVFVGRNSRIGVFSEEFPLVFDAAKKNNIKIIGLHIYLGTQIFDIDHFVNGVELLLGSINQFEHLEYLDLGGGFAIPEDRNDHFDFATYNKKISDLMLRASKQYGKELTLITEPGRVIAGDSGYFITRVTDIKLREDYKYVFVEGSSAIFTRPLFYPELPNHPHYVVGKKDAKRLSNIDICGSTTYSRDFLARSSNELPENLEIGDILVFKNAGSYSYYSKTDFLGIETPPQVLFDGKNFQLISKGEKYTTHDKLNFFRERSKK